MKIIFVDIDNTIDFEDPDANHFNDKPNYPMIEKINKLFDKGNRIVYYTARGTVTKKDWEPLTKEQFEKWGVKYHDLLFGKPEYHIWIDDKALNHNCSECMKRLDKIIK